MLSLHEIRELEWSRQFVDRLRVLRISDDRKVVLKRWLALAWRWRLRSAAAIGIAGALWYFGLPVLLGPIMPVETGAMAGSW